MSVIDYISTNMDQVLSLTGEHIILTVIAVGLAVLIGVPLGILISYFKQASKIVVGSANLVQAIPSMALLGLAIPLLGIGSLPAVVIVILYSLLPIIKNTYTGITSIDKDTLESAKAIGLTKPQVLYKVQIPLALPVIMAGVRISAVTAVGLMTMAAFIGAGGLGFLIFSGIGTVNNAQILAGAIPACFLALFVDYIFGLVEKLVTPISLQNTQDTSKKTVKRNRKIQKFILSGTAAALVVLIAFPMISTKIGASEKVITIAGKDFTEQNIATHMMSELIEDRTDIKVDRKPNLGGTQVCFNALKSGDIDLYLEYSGTAYGDTLGHAPSSDVQLIYDTIKKDMKEQYDVEVLDQMKFNNTYVLAVTKETADAQNLVTISDLAKTGSEMSIGASLEFLNREDGVLGLTKLYGFEFGEKVGINGSNKYLALTNGETDVVDAFSTDGLLKKFDLVTLEDDMNFFPPYYAVPMIRGEVLEAYPELQPILAELGEILTDEIMMELNYRVDELHEQPSAVAIDFLTQQGLLQNN